MIGLYTMTPDSHFITDRHPNIGGLVCATGFSGHGFWFAPAIGEIMTDMALDGASRHKIGFRSAGRFALLCPHSQDNAASKVTADNKVERRLSKRVAALRQSFNNPEPRCGEDMESAIEKAGQPGKAAIRPMTATSPV